MLTAAGHRARAAPCRARRSGSGPHRAARSRRATRSRVVLPQPELPTSEKSSPRLIVEIDVVEGEQRAVALGQAPDLDVRRGLLRRSAALPVVLHRRFHIRHCAQHLCEAAAVPSASTIRRIPPFSGGNRQPARRCVVRRQTRLPYCQVKPLPAMLAVLRDPARTSSAASSKSGGARAAATTVTATTRATPRIA